MPRGELRNRTIDRFQTSGAVRPDLGTETLAECARLECETLKLDPVGCHSSRGAIQIVQRPT
jgi:hypothetical protein